MDERDKYHRIVVIGTSCSGKTTLARQLSQQLHIPHIELDALHWKPNWVPTPREELRPLVENAIAIDNWTLDGNYAATRDLVWSRATTIIWLDYPLHLVLRRAIRRTFKRVVYREELWNGNRESLRTTLSRDSILVWVLKTYRKNHREYRALLPHYKSENPQTQVLIFRSPAETRRYLQTQSAS
ncbi:MAG TPA: hypothetical protein VF719_01570 [Abditibacteriaceae bacterium]|jgi:adenylate kinase family enzyme